MTLLAVWDAHTGYVHRYEDQKLTHMAKVEYPLQCGLADIIEIFREQAPTQFQDFAVDGSWTPWQR